MSTNRKKVVLFDGSSLAFRAFFAIRDFSKFTNRNGRHTNALYTFHRMLTHVLEVEKPDYALVAWDAGKTTFRTEMYADYKGGRLSAPQEFCEQMPFFNPLLEGFGIAHYELANYEADDIIGTMAMQAKDAGHEVVIVSGDKDLTQLAREHVSVQLNRRGVSEMDVYTPETIQESMGITPEQIIDLKGLMGDSSDNYHGVSGIGEKTALKLIKEYGSIETIYEHIDDISGKKRRENLINDRDQAFLSKKLARIETHAPLTITLEDIEKQPRDVEKLRAFYQDMDFNQFLTALTGEEATPEVTENQEVPEYTLIENADAITPDCFGETAQALYGEMLETNYHEGTLVAVAWGRDEEIYVADASIALASDVFKQWLNDATQQKWVFDGKRQSIMFHRYQAPLKGINEDVLIGSYLSHAKDLSDDIALVSEAENLPAFPHDEAIYGKGKKRQVPNERTVMYDHLAQKIKLIQTLVPLEHEHLKQDQMMDLYREMELPLAEVLTQMEWQGIHVEQGVLDELKKDFAQRLDDLEVAIYNEAGHTFTVNSTYQLSDVLFQEMGLKGGKKLKKKADDGHAYYSTAQGELEKLQGVKIVDLILNYRQLAKLQSTYVEGLQTAIHAHDKKVHTRFIQTLTATGRLSSADPNLQNIPIRSEEGRQIRRAFMSDKPGWLIFSSDYSQIELRVLAHISGDKHLKQAFIDGKDIHTDTASKVLGIPHDEVTANQRRQAKAVNFGIVYGISDYGLSQNLGIPRAEAQAFIDRYFQTYPDVKRFMDDIVALAKDKGYVETLFHRRRYLPDINARNFAVRSFAERTAMNSPIQGTAADIIKIAMVKMAQALKEHHLKANLLLQVHDELIFEVPEEELETLTKVVKSVMEQAVDLDVPLVADANYGPTWYEAK
ncbi:MAG: DNA polymerase I [Aerococcus sp.]|nr:DNA polymerase I [Aerococcus sp.]